MPSRLEKRGALAQIEQMGQKMQKEVKKEKQKQDAQRLPKVKKGLNLEAVTVALISKIQADAVTRGWKKPAEGAVIDEAIAMLAKDRGVEID